MSRINITVDVVTTGKLISFIAPCESSIATCLIINNVEYIISDANNNNIGGTPKLWTNGAIVSIIVNTETRRAYIQNTITPASIGAAPAYTYGTKDIEAGSPSTEPEGTLHWVYE